MTYVVSVFVVWIPLALLALIIVTVVRLVFRQRRLKQEARSYYAAFKELNTPKDRERYRW